ncbi:MAG: hypothetical protein C4576_15960 [Desulfobacteraceae bacterium]|nr:MAG: hypothetical protein C4576_15960 [Desulfobacteraceae bacterium]
MRFLSSITLAPGRGGWLIPRKRKVTKPVGESLNRYLVEKTFISWQRRKDPRIFPLAHSTAALLEI